LAPADFWLFPEFKSVLKGKKALLGRWGHSIICEKILIGVLVHDFKNCFEQWPKRWEYYKEFEGDYLEKFYLANICRIN
jgi:hypothetical protein